MQHLSKSADTWSMFVRTWTPSSTFKDPNSTCSEPSSIALPKSVPDLAATTEDGPHSVLKSLHFKTGSSVDTWIAVQIALLAALHNYPMAGFGPLMPCINMLEIVDLLKTHYRAP